MAGSFSDYLENEILDHIFQTSSSYSRPTHLYVAAYTSDPSDSGGGTEVSGSNYSRVTFDSWNIASSGTTYNTAKIEFPTATSNNWGTIRAVGIFDALTSGNLLIWSELEGNQNMNNNDVLTFQIGSLTILW